MGERLQLRDRRVGTCNDVARQLTAESGDVRAVIGGGVVVSGIADPFWKFGDEPGALSQFGSARARQRTNRTRRFLEVRGIEAMVD